MEVVVPMAPSAPSSPRTTSGAGDHLPNYYYFFSSAPTSPSRANNFAGGADDQQAFDFAFGFSGQLPESAPILAAADELFEGGRIRPLNSNPQHRTPPTDDTSISPRSPRRMGGEVPELGAARERGRTSRPAPISTAGPSRSRRGTRSLSPLRGGGGEEDLHQGLGAPSSPPSPRTSLMRGCGSGSKKWRLKDLFLFRSASEGRATGAGSKDPLLKYTLLSPSSSSSFLQSPKLKNGEGGAASMRKGRGSTASASDMPYAFSKAPAPPTTPLPFHRNSLFGYLRSNPAIHSISRKLSSYSSNRGRTST